MPAWPEATLACLTGGNLLAGNWEGGGARAVEAGVVDAGRRLIVEGGAGHGSVHLLSLEREGGWVGRWAGREP